MKIVLESPLRAPDRDGFLRNILYAAWCSRVLTLNGHTVWASHLYAPHFLDDRVPDERGRGMSLTDAFTDDSWSHVFATDHGTSSGMRWAEGRYAARQLFDLSLAHGYFEARYGCLSKDLIGHKDAWVAIERGEWPPCTPGFALGGVR